MFAPDSFIYFVILLIINVVYATHLLFSYNRTILVQLNALAFVLLAFRCCSEFYLPQIDNFTTASTLASFHSIAIFVQVAIMDICTWWYIRPFKGNKYESYFNWGFTALEIVVQLIYIPLLWNRVIYKFAPEKINGYWQYYANYDSPWMYFYLISSLTLICIIMPVLLKSIIEEKKFKLGKWVLFIAYAGTVFLVTYASWTATGVNYRIPNTVVFHMFFALVISWLLTDYRLFKDTSLDVVGDTFDSISDFVVFTNTEYNVLQSNQQASILLSLEEGSKNLLDAVTNHSRMLVTEAQALLNTLITNTGIIEEFKLEIDGQSRLFTIKASEYFKMDKLLGYTFFITDITQQRENEHQLAKQNKQLQQLNNVKDRIFAIIGHDLRKPALAFRGITKKVNYLLQKQDFKTLSAFGSTIEAEALALNKLTDNLLNWALMQKNIMPYHPNTLRVADVVEENVHLFKKMAKDKDLSLVSKVPIELQVFADRNALHTIVRNLIDNAIKYTPVGGKVEIEAEDTIEGVRIQVRDTGVGIPKEKLHDIFLLNQDKSEAGTAGEKGTGLGLHLVQELVKLNKGSLDVASRVGEGTAFKVILPSGGLKLVS